MFFHIEIGGGPTPTAADDTAIIPLVSSLVLLRVVDAFNYRRNTYHWSASTNHSSTLAIR